MTKSEFLTALATTADRYTWTISNGVIRGEGPDRARTYCPVTAVCHTEQGKTYEVDKFQSAAKLLDLDVWTANDITYAADHSHFWSQPEMATLRQQLLTTLNLKEVSNAQTDKDTTPSDDSQ